MNGTWTLHVDNFAKIKKADVKLNSLMCFVGDNNSGKSYLMSLLWGILTIGKDFFPKKPSKSKTYIECERWLESVQNQDVLIDDAVSSLYITWFNEILNSNKKALMKKLFNFEVAIEKLEIRDYFREKPISIKWNENRERYSTQKNSIFFPKREVISRDELLKMNSYICWFMVMGELSAPLLTQAVMGRRNGEPVYLPASRTGFMLTYPQLVESSLQKSFSTEQEDSVSLLTLPYVDFLQLITRFEVSVKKNKYIEIIDFMENRMTNGDLSVKKQMLPVIKYHPKGSDKELPLHVASSIISETAPLLLLLKSNIKFNTLIIEEPEAHLHPELQQQMARVIIRIVNSGIPVWLTTHSDTMIQHINNMIKLKGNTKTKQNQLMNEFSYEPEDLISRDNISMYQFVKEDYRSRLEELECNKYGFVVNTFNDSLKKILDEVYAFQDED